MHKSDLEPKEPHQQWVHGNDTDVEDSDFERHDYAGVWLDSKNPDKVLDSSSSLVLFPRNAKRRSRAINSCWVANQSTGEQ
jgi:hypothetical protein